MVQEWDRNEKWYESVFHWQMSGQVRNNHMPNALHADIYIQHL